ncbi:hypothetical protein LTR15_012142 [Elasticomyces elasticus]|nr:hypothetical protein LTR15_012142 [Elasticomyces elasticus]
MSIKRVAVVGATGAIGEPITKALLAAGFEVTAFTRSLSRNIFPPGVRVSPVDDYEDVAGLTEALKGQHALISTIAIGGAAYQKNLLDAAIAAGMTRFLPSEFGGDLQNAKVKTLPIFADKIAVEEYAAQKCKGTGTSYTFVYVNAFLDWGLVNHGLLLDLPGKKIQMVNGGETSFTANTVDFIAQGVLAILQNLDATANRAVRLNQAVVTQAQLLGLSKKYAGSEGWEVDTVSTETLEQKADQNLKENPANPAAYVLPYVKRTLYGRDCGGNFDGKDDNDVLGLRKMTDEELEQMIKSLVK